MAAGGEFVEGWLVAQVLGEGAYGEVRLLVHARSGARVALKVLRGSGAREAALHRALRHAHVLRCLGERRHLQQHYLFLEYAPGGELFERIEPDAGMREPLARRYWRQLLAGLRYLHARGVAHRDLKPENLLLDQHDDLKISDFGMATLFRHGSRERLLSRVCGTRPYAAPEVLAAAAAPYRAPPADLWAAGLVLLAMLSGELPWERASPADERYAEWAASEASEASEAGEAGAAPARGPWRKLGAGALALLRRVLCADATRRATLDALLDMPWAQQQEPAERSWRSQPAADATEALSAADMDALVSYSQPAAPAELLPPGAAPRNCVWLRGSAGAGLRALAGALGERGYACRRVQPRLLAADCGELKLRAWAQDAAPGAAALQLRRWRGCGLQFKRECKALRTALAHLAVPPPDPALDMTL